YVLPRAGVRADDDPRPPGGRVVLDDARAEVRQRQQHAVGRLPHRLDVGDEEGSLLLAEGAGRAPQRRARARRGRVLRALGQDEEVEEVNLLVHLLVGRVVLRGLRHLAVVAVGERRGGGRGGDGVENLIRGAEVWGRGREGRAGSAARVAEGRDQREAVAVHLRAPVAAAGRERVGDGLQVLAHVQQRQPRVRPLIHVPRRGLRVGDLRERHGEGAHAGHADVRERRLVGGREVEQGREVAGGGGVEARDQPRRRGPR